MNPNHFGDPLTFSIAPPAGQSIHLSKETLQHLLDRLTQNYVQTFMVPRRCILLTLMIPTFPLAPP